jgi:hypothetical protein
VRFSIPFPSNSSYDICADDFSFNAVKPFAIVPWFLVVVTLVTAGVLYVAGCASTDESHAPAVSSIPDSTEKASVPSHHEQATA